MVERKRELGVDRIFARHRHWVLTLGLLLLVELVVTGTDFELKVALARPASRPQMDRATPVPGGNQIDVRPVGSEFVTIRRGGDVPLDENDLSMICRVLQNGTDGQGKVDSLVAGCMYRIEAVSYDVIYPLLPHDLDGLRIVQLSDIHVGRYITKEDTRKMAAFASALEPDLVLLTGDFVFHPEPGQVEEGLAPFGEISAPLGLYASIGNHDYWDDEVVVRDALHAAGIPLLVNENREIVPSLWLASLDDLLAGTPDLDRTLQGIPAGSATILVSHSPNILPKVADLPLVVLSGHTHGGQIRLPWQDSLVNADSSFFSQLVTAYEMTGFLIYGGNRDGVGTWRYMQGWFHEGQASMYVSRGLGVTRPPVRYDCPAEITLFTLRSQGTE